MARLAAAAARADASARWAPVAGRVFMLARAANDNGAVSHDRAGRPAVADRVVSLMHAFPNDAADNVTLTYAYDPADREVGRAYDNAAYAHASTAATTAYGGANALNQYPAVAGYPYTYWPEGELKQTAAMLGQYNELGKLTWDYITPTPGTVDPNNLAFRGVDALDHVYFHERQVTAGSLYPFIYHADDGLRPETILEWQWQGQNGAPVTYQGARRYVLGPGPDERWAFLDINGTIDAPHTDRQGNLIALGNGGKAYLITTYDAYGQSASPATDVGPGTRSYLYRYTGQRLDPGTGHTRNS